MINICASSIFSVEMKPFISHSLVWQVSTRIFLSISMFCSVVFCSIDFEFWNGDYFVTRREVFQNFAYELNHASLTVARTVVRWNLSKSRRITGEIYWSWNISTCLERNWTVLSHVISCHFNNVKYISHFEFSLTYLDLAFCSIIMSSAACKRLWCNKRILFVEFDHRKSTIVI